jgi:hypothetical protein
MNAAGVRQAAPSALEPLAESLPGRDEVERINRQVKAFVAERPVLAVFLALTAGYVVGRILSRAS